MIFAEANLVLLVGFVARASYENPVPVVAIDSPRFGRRGIRMTPRRKYVTSGEQLPGGDWASKVAGLPADGSLRIEDLWPSLPLVVSAFIRDVLGLTGAPTVPRDEFAAAHFISRACVDWIDHRLSDLMRYPSAPPIPWGLVETPGFPDEATN